MDEITETFWTAYTKELLETHSTETDDWDDLPDFERDGIIAGAHAVAQRVWNPDAIEEAA